MRTKSSFASSSYAFFAAAMLVVASVAVAQSTPPPSDPPKLDDGHGLAQNDSADKPPSPADAVEQKKPGFLVRAEVNHPTRSYREGDYLSVKVACEVDAHVYVLYQQADGQVFLVFPNAMQKDSRVKARQAVSIPASNDDFRWEIGEPFGKEMIKVLASQEPLDILQDPDLRKEVFNRVTPRQVKGLQLELGKENLPDWAEDTVEITTYARDKQLEASSKRRYGVFIGIGNYEATGGTVLGASGRTQRIALPYHRNARAMASMMREAGRLTDLRICTNEQATRHEIEEVLAKWLPAVSRPGDSVFIYFSGMVLPSPDENRKEWVLAAHNYVTASLLAELEKAEAEKKLPEEMRAPLQRAQSLVQRAGSPEKVGAVMADNTSINNALFAHWLQRLADRQVAIILDASFSQSFMLGESLTNGSQPRSDPLHDGLERLSRLGQKEIALLGIADPITPNLPFNPEELSPLTVALLKAMGDAPGALTLEQAQETAAKMIPDLVQQSNQAAHSSLMQSPSPPKPYLLNHCSKPIMLKP